MSKNAAQLHSPPRRRSNRKLAPQDRVELGGGATVSVIPVWDDLVGHPRESEALRNRGAHRRDAVLRRALVMADVTGVFGAFLIAISFFGHERISIRPGAALIPVFAVLVIKAMGLYDRDQNRLQKSTIDELPSIIYLSLICTLAIWLAEQLLIRGWLDRPQVFALAAACLILVTVGRTLARRLALAITPLERCIVIGNATHATRAAAKLGSAPAVKAAVVGRIPLDRDDRAEAIGAPTLAPDVSALPSVVVEQKADRVIIAPSSDEEDEPLHAIRLAKAVGVKVSVLPRLLEVVGSSSTFDEIDGITLLGVRQYGLSSSSALLKRSVDLVASLLGIALLSPLLLVIGLLIKLDTSGPMFFRQPRVGRRGNGFEMFKFRSMFDGADRVKEGLRQLNEAGGGLFKISEDPRVTRVGRFLRRTSLDELPQLFNVVLGHMSLVGPRPLIADEAALLEGWQRRRLAVQPGITGLWQIYGSSRIPMYEMVKIDYLYGANWSVWLDLKILLKTVPYVMRRRGM